jgi:hypothetical protein
MINAMITAKYPLIGTKYFIEITIGRSEPDPKSKYNDRRCECKISAPNYEKIFYAYGIDEIQCVWLGLKRIRVEIAEFEKKTNMKCEYLYFDESEE